MIPLPDGSVDEALGEGSEAELRRVLRAMKRAVVLGMARSGQAAAELLEQHGVEVVPVDRSLGNDEDVSLLDGADVLVKSPGVPRVERARRGERGSRSGARSSSAAALSAEPDPRRHRDEREDDDDRVARRDVPGRRPTGCRRRQRRPGR